jgi:hypothetical protein
MGYTQTAFLTQDSLQAPSPRQLENDMRCATGTPAIGAHINAHTNAHIIFPRTSVTSEMARTSFCQLRTSFCQLRTSFCLVAHTILL